MMPQNGLRCNMAKSIKVIIGILFGVAVFVPGVVALASSRVETSCTVTDKDRVTGTEGKSNMRVYTEQCGVLNVEDSLLDLQFNSANVFSSIKVGETYDFKTRGLRIPLLSMFPNIVSVTVS